MRRVGKGMRILTKIKMRMRMRYKLEEKGQGKEGDLFKLGLAEGEVLVLLDLALEDVGELLLVRGGGAEENIALLLALGRLHDDLKGVDHVWKGGEMEREELR